MTLASTQKITNFSASFGGFNGTAGDVSLKVGSTEIGSGSLNATTDVEITNTSEATGTVLTVEVTNIAKGVKCYSISYTYTTACDKSVTVSNGNSSTNGSITSITTSPVATCSSTASDRRVSIVVTPSTGYVAPTDLSVGTKTGTVTSSQYSRTDNGNGTFTFVYEYNQNDNGNISYNAACVGKQCTVTFEKYSGTGGDNSVTATYGSGMPSVTPPTRTHYDFGGYWDGANGTGNQYYKADGTSNANWNKNTTANTTLYAKWTEHGLKNYRTTCCTELATVSGAISVGSINETGGTASWSWSKATTGISKNILKVYNTSDILVKTIDNISAAATSQSISGLDPCTSYYVTLTTVASSSAYCDGAEQGKSSNFTTNGWAVHYTGGDETEGALLSNVTKVTGASQACLSEDYVATFTANTGYQLPTTIVVYIAGVEVDVDDAYTWSISNGTGTLTVETDDLSEEIDVRIIGECIEPEIGTQPASATYQEGASPSALTVAATLASGTLTYQWQKSTDGGTNWSNESGTGYNTNTYAAANISTALVANGVQYRCIVGNSDGGCTVTSSVATITITAAANFVNGNTIFIQAESNSAWDEKACVKAWFNNNGADGAAQTTYWLFDATGDDAGKKLFATVVPAEGDVNQVTLQRFAEGCGSHWNDNGTLTKASDGGSNTFRSTGSGTSNVAWNGSGVTLDLYGDPSNDEWASSLASFSDDGNGVWTATYNGYAPADAEGESQNFKIKTNYNGWIGNTGANENATLDGMHVGSTYNITATLDVTDHSLVMSKTFVKGEVSFDLQGHGDAIAKLTNVTAGSKISAPSPAPSATGYTFGGWFKEPACTNEWNFATDEVDETMTLYAKWTANVYTITKTFSNVANEGLPASFTYTGSMTTALNSSFTVDGDNFFLPSSIAVTMGGTPLTAGSDYTYNSNTGAFTFSAVISGDIIITASATAKLKSIAITTQPTTRKYFAGESFSSTGAVVTATMGDGSSKTVSATWTPAGALSAETGKTMTATYTEAGINATATTTIDVYSVTVKTTDPDGEEFTADGVTATWTVGTKALAASATSASKYVFKEWEVTGASIGSTSSANTNLNSPTANVVVKAKFYKPVTVTWLNNGDDYTPTTPGTALVVYNGNVTTLPSPAPSAPTKCSGKVFVGWRATEIEGVSSSDPGSIYTTAAGMPKLTNNTTFHAVWADEDVNDNTYELTNAEIQARYVGGSGSDKTTSYGVYDITSASGTWSGRMIINLANSVYFVQISSDNTNRQLGSPTFDDNITNITVKARHNASNNARSVYICSSNSTAQPSSGDIGSGSIDAGPGSGVFTDWTDITVTPSGNHKKFYIYADGGLQIKSVSVTTSSTTRSNYITACCKSAPTVGAASNSAVGATTATVTCADGATIGSKGCAIEEYGFVVGTAENPSVDDEEVVKYALTGEFVTSTSFSKDLSGLTAGDTYYVRPFATNDFGTAYGEQTSFTTLAVTSISLKTGATQTVYVDGEAFNGTGLVITENYNDNVSHNDIPYVGNESSFSFSALTTGTTTVTITYSGKTTTQTGLTVYGVNTVGVEDEDENDLSGDGKPTASRDGADLSTSAGTEMYVFKEWQVTNASVVNNKIVNPSGEVSITAVYWKPRVVIWKNNNITHATTTVAYDTKPEFPSTPSSDDATSTTFVGWSTATWEGKINSLTGKTVYTSADDMQKMTAETATYHAVFVNEDNGYKKVTTLGGITGGSYIIVNAGYALPNATVTNNGPDKTSADAVTMSSDGTKVIAPISGYVWTFTGTNSAMTITNPNGKYLYNISNNDGVRVSAPSDDTWAFETNTSAPAFAMKDASNSRYCAIYSTGSDWRSYETKNHSNYADGGKIYLYKYDESRTGYMTTKTYTVTCQVTPEGYGIVSPASVSNVLKGTTISASGNVLNIGETTVTATPTEMTAQYEYAFSGWSWTPNVEEVGNADITATATFTRSVRSYDISATLENVTANEAFPSTQEYGNSFSRTITAGGDYVLPAEISVEGATYTWNRETGALDITAVQGPVSISISGVGAYKLIFVEEDNTEINVIKVATGEEYTHTITEVPSNILDGFEFAGRWTDGTTVYTGSITVSEAKTLKPCWKKTTTEDTDVDDLPASVTDIVVANEKELTIDADRNLESLTVQAGGTVTVAENMGLEVNNITIESQAGKSGQLIQEENASATINGALYLDIKLLDGTGTMTTEQSREWYCISAPFEVSFNDGFFWADGTPMGYNVDFQAFVYDGGKRASNGTSGWQRVSGTMEAGKAYLIGFDDEKENQKTIRLKAMSNTIPTASQIDIEAHDADDANKNWNGVGNPTLHYIALDGFSAKVQCYDNNLRTYKVYDPTTHNYVVGTALFMQATSNINLADPDNEKFRAPRRVNAENERYSFCVELAKEGATRCDSRLYVSASDEATSSYEPGKDMLTMNGTSAKFAALIWTENYGKRLASEDVPMVNNKATYSMGIFAPNAGTYTISTTEASENATLYLTKNGRIYWNLTMGACELELAQGQNNEYGLVLRAEAPAVTTGVETVSGERLEVSGAQKVIIDEHVYILRGGEMYDMTGKAVK